MIRTLWLASVAKNNLGFGFKSFVLQKNVNQYLLRFPVRILKIVTVKQALEERGGHV